MDFGKNTQGASTVSEFGLREITDLVDFIVEQNSCYFLKTLLVLRLWRVLRGCASKGFEVKLDGIIKR